MPPVESLSHPLTEALPVRGASSLTNRDKVYEMTRDHIKKDLPLGILIDEDGMTLTPTGEVSKTNNGDLPVYALRDGSINPHIRVRSEIPLPCQPEKGTILFSLPEVDLDIYSGFTVVEVFTK